MGIMMARRKWHNMKKVILMILSCLFLVCLEAKDTVSSPSKIAVVKVLERSTLPEPKSAAYDDCYFTCKVQIKSILSGTFQTEEILVIAPGFIARKLAPKQDLYKQGKTLKLSLIKFAKLPEEQRQIQQADDIFEIDLEPYFVVGAEPFDGDTTASNYTPQTPRTEKIVKLPKSDGEKQERREVMAASLEQIKRQLRKRAKFFKKLKLKYSQEVVAKQGTLIWDGDALVPVSIVKKKTLGAADSPAPESVFEAIRILDRELKQRNVDLIVISIPYQYEIYLSFLTGKSIAPEDSFNASRLNLVKKLLENDIEVIDFGRILAERYKDEQTIFDTPRKDFHPASGMVKIMAEVLAERLRRYDLKKYELPVEDFSLYMVDNISNVKWPAGNNKFSGKMYQNIGVKYQNKPIRSFDKSPVVVLGDSFAVTPWSSTRDTGLPAMLAYKTRVIPFVNNSFGSAMWVVPNLYRNGLSVFNNRKVCIFIFNPLYLNDWWMAMDRETMIRFKNAEKVFDSGDAKIQKIENLKVEKKKLGIEVHSATGKGQGSFEIVIPDKIINNNSEKFLFLATSSVKTSLRCIVYSNRRVKTVITGNPSNPICNGIIRFDAPMSACRLKFLFYKFPEDGSFNLDKLEVRVEK